MKKTFTLLAAGLSVLVSCSKTELEPAPCHEVSGGYTGITMTVTPRMAETKTAFADNGDGTYAALWTSGDAISMSYCAAGASEFSDFNKKLSSTATDRTSDTKFSGIIYAPAKAGDYDFYAVYPQSRVKDNSIPGAVKVFLPQAQCFGAGTFDPSADILFGEKRTIAVSSDAKELKNTDIRFARIVSLARIKVDAASCTNPSADLSEPVVGVSLRNDAGISFAGTITVDPDRLSRISVGEDGRTGIEGAPVSGTTLGSLDAMLALAPCDINAGAGLTIVIRTTSRIYTKKVGLPAATSFNPGEVKLLTCRIDGQWTVADAPVFSGGSGTEADPYLISYPADLLQLSALSNGAEAATYNDKHYVQTADIDMAAAGTFTPVGSTTAFSGSYDGNGHTVSNIDAVGKSGAPSGFFSQLSGAEVSNLAVKDMTVSAYASYVGGITGKAEAATVISGCRYEGNLTSDRQYLGGIAGYCAKSTIDNCEVKGVVKNLYLSTRYSGETDNAYTGGIAGQFCQNSSSEGCTVDGKVYSTASYTGGFGAYMTTSKIKGFHLTKGSEVSSDENYIGGVLAYQGGSSNVSFTTNRVDDCIVEGTVGGRGNQVAGISARITAGEIKGCLVSSSASVSTYKRIAGGIVGIANPTQYPVRITNCAAYCDVTAYNDVGGVVSTTQASATSGNNGSVKVTNCAYVGGRLYATLYYNNGGRLQGRVGGIVGNLIGSTVNGPSVTIVNCYARPEHVAVNRKATSPCSSGMAGLLGTRCSICNCYTDLGVNNLFFEWKKLTELSGSELADASYGALFGWYGTSASGNGIELKDLYYMGSIPACPDASVFEANGLLSNYGTFTTATAGEDLVARLNAGVDAYNGTYPDIPAVKWVVGSDGFATLSNILGDPNVKKQDPIRVSVIGDSISTFRGYIPNGYGAHYPTTDGALDFVQQTYWWKLINEYMTNAVLEKNISNSGTTVAKRDESFEYSTSGGHCFIYRYTREGLGRPDVVLIAGGTNDWTHIKDMGNGVSCKDATDAPSDSYLNSLYSQSTIPVSDSTKFCPAYVHLLRSITNDHPNAKIVCIIGDRESTGQQKAIMKMAEHYGAKVVDLLSVNGFNENTFMPKHDYASGGVHPDAVGHAFIANKIYAECGQWLEDFDQPVGTGTERIGDFDDVNSDDFKQ